MYLHDLLSTCSSNKEFYLHPLVQKITTDYGYQDFGRYCYFQNGQLHVTKYHHISHIMSYFPDLALVDRELALGLVQAIINLSLDYGIFSNGDQYIKQYKDNNTYFTSDIDKVFDLTLKESRLLFKPRRNRQNNMNIRFNQKLYADNKKSFVRFDIHVPTYNKSFVISLFKIDGVHYLSVPKYSESVQHPDNDILPIDFDNLNDTLWAVVDSRYRYRVYYSNLRKELVKYYGKDVSLDNIDISEAIAVIDAIEY